LTNPRMRRAAVAVALATSLLVVFAALGGVGVARSAISSAQYQYGKKVTICHKGHTISVGKAAEPAHVRHGDSVGTCAAAKAKKAKAAKAAKKAAQAAAAKAKAAAKKQDDSSSDKPGQGNGKGKGGKG
jgi:hypothetical protein